MASKQSMGLVAVLVTVAGLALFGAKANANAALADGQPSVGQTAVAFSDIQLTAQDVAIVSAVSRGSLQLRWEMPEGWQPQSAKGCIWVHGGKNSYIAPDGHRVFVSWKGKRAYICPDPTSSTGWRKAGGPPNWENCGNEFIPPFSHKKAKVFRGKFVVVKNFTWRIKVRAQLAATAAAYAQCSVGGASAWALAYGVGFASAEVTFTATARTKEEAAASIGSSLSISDKESLKASAAAAATLNLKANAAVSCTGAVPSPPVTPPGSPPPPNTPPPPQPKCTGGTCLPPPPPGAPGPNPADDPGPPPPDPNNLGVTCPPPLVPDGFGGCNNP
jgi:hypothetical protein